MNSTLKNRILTPFNILYKANPKLVLKLLFYIKHQKKLDIEKPETYNEKLNWMKLNYRNDLMPLCTDKFTVRQYVENCGCGDILNKLLWEGFDAREIPFDDLPRKFVIKVTHGSGYNIICTDKDNLDREKIIEQLNHWLKQKYLSCYGEWFYGIIKPRIIIEAYLSQDNLHVPLDYKMFCFNNINGSQGVALTAVDTGRFINHKRKVYDINWNLLPNVQISFPYDAENDFEKPAQYQKMIQYAEKLSAPFPHARIDFYVVNNRLYFGEITFMSDAGFGKILPLSMSKDMGSWIRI